MEKVCFVKFEKLSEEDQAEELRQNRSHMVGHEDSPFYDDDLPYY